MKKTLILVLLMNMTMSACKFQDITKNDIIDVQDTSSSRTSMMEESMRKENELVLSVNETPLSVSWENNQTVGELLNYVQNENIVVDTTLFGGFEQVGDLPQSFSRNDIQITTQPGDIVLYSGNKIVLFFGTNSWSYTKLGHIEELTKQELSQLLGNDSAVIKLKTN